MQFKLVSIFVDVEDHNDGLDHNDVGVGKKGNKTLDKSCAVYVVLDLR